MGVTANAALRAILGGVMAVALAGCITPTDTKKDDPPPRTAPQPPRAEADGGHRTMHRFAVGDPIAAVQQALGPPTLRRTLDNDSPWTMGAAVVEYGFADPVLRFEGEPAGGDVPGRAVQFVVDPDGHVLRLLRNPNPPGPETMRTLRGPSGPAQAVLVPPGAAPLADPSDGGQ